MSELILSLFPGAGLLDRGFELEGFCVVRGPDVVFGQDIRTFTPPAGRFTGIIGGPPCQDFSRARRRPPTGHGREMLREFARCVAAAFPDWFLLENVPGVPDISELAHGYTVQRFNLFASDAGCAQRRNRAFQFGFKTGRSLILMRTRSHFPVSPAPMASDTHRNFAELCELQGLPRNFDLPGLSRSAKVRAVGNGVPVAMARLVAHAIRFRDAGIITGRVCACQCGRIVTGRQKTASATCRKKMQREREKAFDAKRAVSSFASP